MRHLLRLALVIGLLTAAFAVPGASGAPGDVDNDTWADAVDNCPTVYNVDSSEGQFDFDGDGLGNTCDSTPGVPANESNTIVYFRDAATGGPLAADPNDPRCATVRFDAYVNDVLANTNTACYRRFVRVRLGKQTAHVYATLTLVQEPPGCRHLYSDPITVNYEGDGAWIVINAFFDCGGDIPLLELPPEVLLQMYLSGQITIEQLQQAWAVLASRYFAPVHTSSPRPHP
jgi:thrombospondin type 3 repeat protein